MTVTQPNQPLPFRPVIPASAVALAAETLVPLLDARPDAIPQVRGAVASGQDGVPAVQRVFRLLDTDQNGVLTIAELDRNPITAPFRQLYHSTGVFAQQLDAQIQIEPADLTGDPSFLFSYHALRQLTVYYADADDGRHGHEAVQPLLERLRAAQEAEEEGDCRETAEALEGYRKLVRRQTGRTFTPAQAHVLIVMSEIL